MAASDILRQLLADVRDGNISVDAAMRALDGGEYVDIGHAKVDTGRVVRTGAPEIIYGEGKHPEEVADIAKVMLSHGANVLVTRASAAVHEALLPVDHRAVFNARARTVSIVQRPVPAPPTYIAIVTGGTSDLPVAEEARETACFLGNTVKMVPDAGVAGIHRLLGAVDTIRGARVVIAVAGMEGALASVVGGLVEKPVIAVPTSVGYGASFGGLAALLAMLNSCAAGVGVVNIDNGFGAGYLASMINRLGLY